MKLSDFFKSKVFENISALMLLQIGNYAIPVLVMPYLIKTLGIEGFGVYSFVLAISMNLVILIDYGFSIYGAKVISIAREKKSEVSQLYSSIQFIKVSLLTVILVIYFLLINGFDFFEENRSVYLLSFLVIIGQTIIPVWFFQGMENMKFITIVNLSIRTGFAFLVFVFVKEESDLNLVMFAQGVSYLAAGLLSVVIARFSFGNKLVKPKANVLRDLINGSKHVFISTFSIGVFRNINTIIIGFVLGDYAVGFYSAAEKIIRAIQSMISPISSAIFPNLSFKFTNLSYRESIDELVKISKYVFGFVLLVLTVTIVSEPIIYSILKITYSEFSKVYFVLSSLIVFGSMNNLLGISGLINLGFQQKFSRITIIGGVVNVLLSIILITFLGAIGVAFSLVISEIIVFLLVLIELKSIYAIPNE